MSDFGINNPKDIRINEVVEKLIDSTKNGLRNFVFQMKILRKKSQS